MRAERNMLVRPVREVDRVQRTTGRACMSQARLDKVRPKARRVYIANARSELVEALCPGCEGRRWKQQVRRQVPRKGS
jgi:hypothetical protein